MPESNSDAVSIRVAYFQYFYILFYLDIKEDNIKRRSRWWSRRTLNSPPCTNTSKLHLHVEPFWEQDEDCQKDSCRNKSVKKIHMESGRKERVVVRSGLVLFRENTERRGITHAQRSSLGSEWFEPHIGNPSTGIWHWENEFCGTNRKVVRNLDSAHEKYSHASLPPRTRWKM